MRRLLTLVPFLLAVCCSQPPTDRATLTEEQKRSAEFSVSSMEMAEALEVTLFAYEPMLVNPTNMDIDHRGRVWVCEGFNYRLPLNPDKEEKPEGDRILILEDTNLDGVADKQTVFYQGNDINAALGISVMGNKVIVSKSPNILIFTDEDGDDVADQKEILFTGMDANDHDHGIHAVVFGPDGKLYFNAGNEFHQIAHPDGTPVVDMAGNEVNDSGNPYRQGMAFRCNMDGSDFETLGWNFRNPYELAVDSYGNIWQSDNDDDGNRGTRLNLVVEYGNYGFTDEMTGAGWRTGRTGMSDEVPLKHWHLNDPGVVPNLLQLYAGSPTGILFYEGDLMPESYHNGLIHAEAGANVIRSYPVEKDGYGYKSRMVEIMKAADDPWFRPSDVCVAPDGSVFVADWYDPGVGGHLVGDQQKGRIFRIAPSGVSNSIPPQDFETIPGLIEALKSPNQATRFLAWTGLKALEGPARDALMELFNGINPVFSARALWLLAELDAEEVFELGKNSDNEDLQLTALKIARQKFRDDLIPYLQAFTTTNSAQVQRALAVALRFEQGAEAVDLWVSLATQYQGDRWFLEALGIGSDLNSEACFAAWMDQVGSDWKNETNKDIVWRVRSKAALPLLVELILTAENMEKTHRLFRAFDFHRTELKNQALETVLSQINSNQDQYQQLAYRHLDRDYVLASPSLKNGLLALVESQRGTDDFLLTIEKYRLQEYNQEILSGVLNGDANSLSAARLLLKNEPKLLTQVLEGNDQQQISAVLAALGAIGDNPSLEILESFMFDANKPVALRQQAAGNYASSWSGQNRMLELLDNGAIPPELIKAAAGAMSASWRAGIRKEGVKYLDTPEGQHGVETHNISELIGLTGSSAAGKPFFEKFCQSCHLVDGVGTDFGPGLSEIGSKLSREALYVSILNPSAGISFGYEGYLVTLTDGSKISGLIQSRTASEITVKQIGGSITIYSTAQVESIEQLEQSMMTPNLHMQMDKKELVDLIAFLEQLETPG